MINLVKTSKRAYALSALSTILFGLLVLTLHSTPALSQPTISKIDLLRKANDAYYNLPQHGLKSFTAIVKPDWRLVLKSVLKSNPEKGEEALRILDSIKFTFSFDSDQELKVEHHPEAPSIMGVVNYDALVHGTEKTVLGFFTSFKAMMCSAPFPQSLDYDVEDSGDYIIRSEQSSVKSAVTMTKDLLIRKMVVNTPRFDATMLPLFDKGPEGFLLNYMSAVYTVLGKDPVKVILSFDYTTVNGLQLPSAVRTSADSAPGQAVNWTMSDYKITKSK